MDTRSLQLFLDLSRTLRFRETSRRCHLTPSALTRAIARLEEEVGSALFTRDRRKVTLTRRGIRFRDYAEEAIASWETFMADQRHPSDVRGELTFYCSVTASYCVLPRLLWPFRQRHPDVSVILRTGDAEHGLERVTEGEVDAALIPVPARMPASLELVPLLETSLLLIAPVRRCPLQAKLAQQVPWTQLPLILPEAGPAHSAIHAWFKARRLRPDVLAYASGNEAILSMTSLGLGLGIVPKLVAEHAPKSIHVRYLENGPDLKPYTIALCTRKGSKNAVIPVLRQVAGAAFSNP
jgi:LysR family positive regulator for ilvC